MRRTLAMSAMGGGIAAGALAMVAWVSLGGPSWAGGPEPPVAAPWHSPHGCPDAVVTVPIQIERWVEASAATVIVEASLTVDPAGLAKARAEVAAALRALVREEPPERVWRWTSATSTRESSGLARFTGRAEIRAAESAVGDVWERAKAASRPGFALRVLDLRWAPSLADRERERQHAREQAYRIARDEAARIHGAWGGAWRVGRVTFEDERTRPPMEVLTHETARAEAHGSPDTRADRLVVAATVELVEPRCAGSASGGGRP